jgi:hypothetical protein
MPGPMSPPNPPPDRPLPNPGSIPAGGPPISPGPKRPGPPNPNGCCGGTPNPLLWLPLTRKDSLASWEETAGSAESMLVIIAAAVRFIASRRLSVGRPRGGGAAVAVKVRSHSTGRGEGTVTVWVLGMKPNIWTSMLQVPVVRSEKEYRPCSSVTVVTDFSLSLAVTVAPGMGNPPERTTPSCSAAMTTPLHSAVQSAKEATHVRLITPALDNEDDAMPP